MLAHAVLHVWYGSLPVSYGSLPALVSTGFWWLNASMSDRTPQNQDKFIVRLPDGMRDRIRHAAEINNRSMNAEIVATLEEKYPAPKPTLESVLQKRVSQAIREAGITSEDDPRLNEIVQKTAAEFLTRVLANAFGDATLEESSVSSDGSTGNVRLRFRSRSEKARSLLAGLEDPDEGDG